MNYTVFDIETDDLLDSVTKIHCLSYEIYENKNLIKKDNITDYNLIKEFLEKQEILVGHNIIQYDIPVLEKILGYINKARLIDSLGLSWYLYPKNLKHGLEYWGDLLGVEKPKIQDWTNQSIEDYIHRCSTDVVINSKLFHNQMDYLFDLYDKDINKVNNLINYITFKLDCIREQISIGCKIDRSLVLKSLENLETLQKEKLDSLIKAMPKNIKYKSISKPQKLYKKDGSYSSIGLKWINLLDERNLPLNYEDDIIIEVSQENGNPKSSIQVKNWLFSLNWVPETFEDRKNKTGEIQSIPQIYSNDSVCKSIKKLYNIEPALENLDMLSLINHRIGVFKGFLECMNENNYVKAEVQGFTNTLRFQHKRPIANLPKVSKFYGKEIRGSIIKPDENHILCGSDMSSLEDTTKQHYMMFFDPDYVKSMRTPGFDPHIDIGKLAGIISEDEEKFFKWYKKENKL